MKYIIGAFAILSFSASSFASLTVTQSVLSPQANITDDEKICLVVRKSIYGKYRKKCKSTQEWMTFLAEYGPKIKQQLANAGGTRKVNSNAVYSKAPQLAYKEK